MYITPALVAGCLAFKASAFLIPLEVSNAAEQAKSGLTGLLATASHAVDLECPGCPYFGIGDAVEPQDDVENKIHLEFDVDAEQGLLINGVSISPVESRSTDPFILTAPQIKVKDGQQTEGVRLDFIWERLHPITSSDEPDKAIQPFRFTIFGLHGYPVQVDAVVIDLLQTSEQTSIARIDTVPFGDTPGAATCDMTSRWSLCRLRAIIVSRLQEMIEAATARASAATKNWMSEDVQGTEGNGKPCGLGRGRGRPHRGPGGPPGMFGGRGRGRGPFGGGRSHHGPGPHNHGPHGSHHGPFHHRHHRFHRFGHMVHQTLRFFVIPALLGVIGGLMASAVGMLVGQCISYLWIRVHRGGLRGNATRDVRVVEIVVDEEEKDALIVDEKEVAMRPEYEHVDVEKQ